MLHFISAHLLGDTLSPLMSSITCLLLALKNLLVFIFPLQCFCITNGTNSLHVLAELRTVAVAHKDQPGANLVYADSISATLLLQYPGNKKFADIVK